METTQPRKNAGIAFSMDAGRLSPLRKSILGFAKEPYEVPQPGKAPETIPSQEPEPSVWPRKEPEIRREKEPATIPPPAPVEVPMPGSRSSTIS